MSNASCQETFASPVMTPGCPDYDCCHQTCLAGRGKIIPDRRQQMRYCATDNYSRCPVYQSRAQHTNRG